VLYFEKGELSKYVKYFVRVLIKHGIPQTKTLFFHEIEAAVAAKKRANSIMNIYDFQRKTPGYPQCKVSDSQPSDHGHFEPTIWDSRRYSILKGRYVGSYTRFLLCDHSNLIAGFFMDTTWRVIHRCVAPILTAVIANVRMYEFRLLSVLV
jgi:hypothetical protein